ncbi:serine/threonine-protein kinase [Fodinicola acaciae]|uniref:serine/threonine-protein kinase n=1 Tax=Fodinicola acaciae TaxID=2681555 RepID=UPI0013D39405|nr:serine/threonine-protein kinase [Fodinicola acaciae]
MVGAPAGESRVIADRYTVVSAIGQGGMGRVWRARDRILDREVALKELLLPASMAAEVRREMSDRLLKEARLGARLRHPAIVSVYDVLTVDDSPWIVMELINGRSLDDLVMDGGPLPAPQVAEIGIALLGALTAAHKAGVLHRDVKPANVIVGADGAVSLTDFGIAFELDKTSLTATGLMIGSPPFIAPERVRGETIGPPSDLFSLGATLYQAVEGRPPFDREGPLPTLAAILNEPPDPFRLAGPLQPLLAGLLDKDQTRRLDADAALKALKQAAEGAAPLPATSMPTAPAPADPIPVPPPPAGPEASTVQVHQTQVLPMSPPIGRATVSTPPRSGTLYGRPATPPPPVRPAPPPPPPRPTKRRRPIAIVVIVLALVVAAGAGTAVVWTLSHGSTGPTGTPSPKTPTSSASSTPPATVTVEDIRGFKVAVPVGWVSKPTDPKLFAYGPPDQPDSKKIRVQFSQPGQARGSAVDEFQAGSDARADTGSSSHLSGYQLVSIKKVRFAGVDNGARWEFTWLDQGVKRHNVLYGAVTSDGKSWQLATLAPDADFGRYQPLFDIVVADTIIAT